MGSQDGCPGCKDNPQLDQYYPVISTIPPRIQQPCERTMRFALYCPNAFLSLVKVPFGASNLARHRKPSSQSLDLTSMQRLLVIWSSCEEKEGFVLDASS